MDEAIGARLDADVSSVGISRRPISRAIDFAWLNRAIADGCAGQKPMGEGEGINERLEGRADLAIRGWERAIEFALRIIAAAHERANAAARVVDRHERAFEIGHGGIFAVLGRLIARFDWMMEISLTLDFRQLGLERLLGGVLHDWVERGVNKETAVIDLVLGEE